MPTPLEQEFHQSMVNLYRTAKRDLGYNATRFMQMISESGGLAAAQQLLRASSVSEGFTTLWEHSRLDLSVEAHVLDERYKELFTADELTIARRRLNKYGYTA